MRELRPLTPERVADLVGACAPCTFWQTVPRNGHADPREPGELLLDWVETVTADWGPPGRVAYVDGEPAGTAGCTLAAGGRAGGCVARLWGGATRSSLRGRGAYHACVGARLELARRRGADLGLVKAVTTTSAPIVRRLGFTAHGVEDRLRLDIAGLRHRDA